MKRLEIKDEQTFLMTLASGLCCVAKNGERHIVNGAGVGFSEFADIFFVVDTLAGNIAFEDEITLFVFDSAREAQQFLTFERCELDEDEILNSEVIESE